MKELYLFGYCFLVDACGNTTRDFCNKNGLEYDGCDVGYDYCSFRTGLNIWDWIEYPPFIKLDRPFTESEKHQANVIMKNYRRMREDYREIVISRND